MIACRPRLRLITSGRHRTDVADNNGHVAVLELTLSRHINAAAKHT